MILRTYECLQIHVLKSKISQDMCILWEGTRKLSSVNDQSPINKLLLNPDEQLHSLQSNLKTLS